VALRVESLAILLCVHQRAEYLSEIWSQILYLLRGRAGKVFIRFDAPCQEVIAEIDRLAAYTPPHVELIPYEAKSPLRSSDEKSWALGRYDFYEFARAAAHFDAAMSWDDDVLFTTQALRELRAHLDFMEFDRLDCRWAMCWDSRVDENTLIPTHIAACLFRAYPHDKWSRTYVQHAPEFVSLSGTHHLLSAPALHLGYMTQSDRELAWAHAKASGKIDKHSIALRKPPKLVPLTDPKGRPYVTRKPSIRRNFADLVGE